MLLAPFLAFVPPNKVGEISACPPPDLRSCRQPMHPRCHYPTRQRRRHPPRPSTTTAPIGIRPLGIDGSEIPHDDKPGQASGEKARDYLDA